MTRKLLPYEYDLIDALGVTKEDYLDFVAQQHIYADAKQGTALDIRAEPVSIILAIVGILFQLASVLLMPKPKEQKGVDQTRDQVLAPRIGFNGSQELAVYGDPVPLVYTNTAQNSSGGVRVTSLLLWSAILSFGSAQFMRLMMTIGASKIARIDPDRTALGQFPAKDLVLSNVWQYYSENGATRYSNLIKGTGSDPTRTFSNDTTAKLNGLPGAAEGFSQAFSPTTSKSVGVTGFIPIVADVLIVNRFGFAERRRVGVVFTENNAVYWPDNSGDRPLVPVGARWELHIPSTRNVLLTTQTLGLARQDALRAAASQIDSGAIYKIGSALFRVAKAQYNEGASSIEQSSLNATMECIRTGKMPRANYGSSGHYLDREFGPRAMYVKGLARIEEASYSSITKCNVLDIALRFQSYRRISGRSSVYGSSQIQYGHSSSDNGAKARTSMFALWYRFDNTGEYARLPFIFCCRGFNEQNVFAYIKLITNNAGPRHIEVRLEPVIDTFIEIRTFDTRAYCYLDAAAPLVTLGSDATQNSNIQVLYNGSLYIDGNRGDYPPFNRSPRNTTEFDLFNYDAFTTTSFSFDSSTEVQITAVTEQLIEPWSAYSPNLYSGLSTFSLHAVSGAGTQDLRSISAYVTEGKRVRLLPTSQNYFGNEATGAPNDATINTFAASTPSNSTSFAPDIFLDTILDNLNGIGRYASLHSVDVMQLAQSKRFCQRNRLFMDGVIADGRPWREFWAQVAPFSLLELGKIGGKDTLVPALPYIKSTGQITRAVSVTALFNQGNILEDTFKEEFIDYGSSVQDVIITLIYRDGERNSIFPRNNSVEVKRTDTQEANAIRESLDISQFVTTRAQAILLGKYLCNIRRYNRRAIEFVTFPTDIFVMPGSYVYVETSNNQWDGIYTGRIEAGGIFNVPLQGIPNGTYNVLTYGSTDGTRSFNGVTVSNGAAPALASRTGNLFVLGQTVRSKRVFRVTEVTMEEEGETTVRAVEHPCDTNGQSFIAQGISSYVGGLFTIDGGGE